MTDHQGFDRASDCWKAKRATGLPLKCLQRRKVVVCVSLLIVSGISLGQVSKLTACQFTYEGGYRGIDLLLG